jgi:hypothetical protein
MMLNGDVCLCRSGHCLVMLAIEQSVSALVVGVWREGFRKYKECGYRWRKYN